MKPLLTLALCCCLIPAAAAAQDDGVMLRGFGDVGATTFTAEESFAAILGSSTAAAFGGGVEVVLPRRIFVNVRASRFRQTGQRVFVSDGERSVQLHLERLERR